MSNPVKFVNGGGKENALTKTANMPMWAIKTAMVLNPLPQTVQEFLLARTAQAVNG